MSKGHEIAKRNAIREDKTDLAVKGASTSYANGFLRGFDAGYRAGLTRAAEIARAGASYWDPEMFVYRFQYPSEVAAAIEVARDREGEN